MSRWGKIAAALVAVCLVTAGAWAQSTESSRPVRGTGQAGQPDAGVLTIQGVFQGRPVTVDFHHNAAALAVTSHSVGISHITSVVHVTTGFSPHITTLWVVCGTSAAIAVTPKADTIGRRRDLELLNAGTNTIYIGGTHATVSATTGFGLHAGTGTTSRLTLKDFQGRIDCISDVLGQTLQIMEIWR